MRVLLPLLPTLLVSILIFGPISFPASALPLSPTRSVAPNCGFFQKADFLPAQEGLEQIHLPLQMLAASPAITLDLPGEPGESVKCSSSVVSDSGTLLTAGHCLSYCAAGHGGMKKLEPSGKSSASSIDSNAVSNYTCLGTLNGEKAEFKILAAGFCGLGNDFYSLTPEAFEICLKQADYALIQPINVQHSFPCLKVDPVTAQDALGKSVAVIGFPAKTERSANLPGARDARGETQSVSVGFVVRSPSCQRTSKGGKKTEETLGGLEQRRESYLQLDADLVPGNSGGPVVDQRSGKIVGVAGLSAREDWETSECKGSSFASPVAEIEKSLGSFKTPDQIKTMFSCQKNAAVR